jgi:hypothetical protein
MKNAFFAFLNIWFAIYLIVYFNWIKNSLEFFWLLPLMCCIPMINLLVYSIKSIGKEIYVLTDLKKIAIIANVFAEILLIIVFTHDVLYRGSSLIYVYDNQSWMLLGFITAFFSFVFLVENKLKVLIYKIINSMFSKKLP